MLAQSSFRPRLHLTSSNGTSDLNSTRSQCTWYNWDCALVHTIVSTDMAKLSDEVYSRLACNNDAPLELLRTTIRRVCNIAELQYPATNTASMLLLTLHGELGTV